MKPASRPNASRRIFAIGATQFVVHDAFEMMWCCSASYLSSLTPSTIVMSGSVAGAEITTLAAPAVRCCDAPSRSVKRPVDSTTTSTSTSFQGSAVGSRSESTFRDLPSTEIEYGDDLESGVLLEIRAVEVAPDAAEAVDAHFCRHAPSLTTRSGSGRA